MQQDPGRGPHPESHLVMVAFLSSQAVFLRVVVVICGHGTSMVDVRDASHAGHPGFSGWPQGQTRIPLFLFGG